MPRRPKPDFPQVARALKLFPEKLQRAIDARGINQQTLAEHIGVAQSNVQWWLRGKSMLSCASLIRLAIYLDVSVDDLLSLREFKGKEFARQSEIAEMSSQFLELSAKLVQLTATAPVELANDAAVTDHAPMRRLSGAVQRLVRSTNVDDSTPVDGVSLVKHPRKRPG